MLEISPDHVELDHNSKKQNKQHHFRNQSQSKIEIISCNIEGIKSNIAYLHSLQLSKTVLCLQEHHLWDFQKYELTKLLPSMGSAILCHDTNDPLSGFKLSKGQAGVAILWPKEWNSQVKHLKMGNKRVIAVTITSDVNICLINVYLPTQGSHSQFEYTECLDIIFDITDKHQISHKIILCGDLNGTLLDSRSNKHDKLLKKFVSETKLYYDKERNNKPTCYHHVLTSTSQIDYILVSDSNKCTNDLILDNDESINTSVHRAVKMRTSISIPTVPKNVHQGRQPQYKLLWGEIKKDQYNTDCK